MNKRIQELKPSRELDALVAEKVMGLKVTRECPGNCIRSEDVWFLHYELDHRGNPLGQTVHKYSTDIAAAWEVVEKLRPKFNIVLECVSFEFNCHMNTPGNLESRINMRAETAPHAICLAALKAVGAI